MQDQAVSIIGTLLSAYFWKLMAFILVMYGMNLLKDFVFSWFVRNQLKAMEAIHVDKYVRIGSVEGWVLKIGLTHLKMKTKNGYAFCPNRYLLERALILCPKMEPESPDLVPPKPTEEP